MKILCWSILALAPISLHAQDRELSEPSTRETIFKQRPHTVRVDLGFSVLGCQGSYLKEVEWNQVHPSGHHPERSSYWPAFYAELEVRPWERIGILAHADWWRNGRSIEGSNRLWRYDSEAQTYMIGGRWYYDFHTPKMQWYSGLMGGWSHNTSGGAPGVPVVDQSFFAHQITFIGFRKKTARGISMELGQGYKGFLSMAWSLAF